ncbi:MAG: TRAP transporter small permease subunit [Syntrophaceae bacterium]|nr:TRAP transporter small permease subunit [Syntrophaceae bacterium]
MGGEALVKLSNFLDNIIEWSGRIFCWLVVPLTILIIIEFVTRSLDITPIWVDESSRFIFGAHFMLCAAYGLLYGSHVRIDLFVSILSQKAQAIISIICYLLLFFPFVSVWLYYGWGYFYTSWSVAETSISFWAPVVYPIKFVIPFAAFLLIIQGISEVIKSIVTVRILSEISGEVFE